MTNNTLLLKKVLSDDWSKLPDVIQQHYRLDGNNTTCVQGVMEIAYPNFLLPLIYLIHLFGGLILVRGNEVRTVVKKNMSANNSRINWQRTLKTQDNSEDTFCSSMVYKQDHQLIEYVRFGFGLNLKVSVENNDLVYRSNGHIWHCGGFTLTMPDWLLLGKATIVEHKIDDQTFSLNFTIRHPLWGMSYSYKGLFQHIQPC